MSKQLTAEQEQALNALVALVPKGSGPQQSGPDTSGTQPQAQQPLMPALGSIPQIGGDFLMTWFGVSRDEVSGWLQSLLGQRDALEQKLLDWAERRPMDTVFEFLASASLAFYAVEKDVNPKIRTYVDSFYYIATCASVGYADVFAMTQTGRAIASLVMIVGPALTSRSLDRGKVNQSISQ